MMRHETKKLIERPGPGTEVKAKEQNEQGHLQNPELSPMDVQKPMLQEFQCDLRYVRHKSVTVLVM